MMMPSVFLKLVLISLSGVLAGLSFAAAAVRPCQIFRWLTGVSGVEAV